MEDVWNGANESAFSPLLLCQLSSKYLEISELLYCYIIYDFLEIRGLNKAGHIVHSSIIKEARHLAGKYATFGWKRSIWSLGQL